MSFRDFILKRKDAVDPEPDPFETIKDDDLYVVTTYDGKSYVIPGAYINREDDDHFIYNGKYYYIDWESVESILPQS